MNSSFALEETRRYGAAVFLSRIAYMDAPPKYARAAALTTYARIERISEPWSLSRTFAIIITFVLAMVLGTWAASGQFENLILLAVWFAAVMIIVFVRDHWWSPALVITALSVQTTALGFPLTGLEIGMIILGLTLPVKMAMKTLRKAEPEMDPGIFYKLLITFLCIHVVICMGYNHIEGNGLKNIVKSYYSALSPLVLFGLLNRYCHTRTVKPAVIAIFFATLIAVFFSVIVIFTGLNIEPFSELRVSIGWLNVMGAGFIIRYPAILLFTGSIAFWPAVRRGLPRFILGFAIFFSSIGVLESGGRLSLITCLCGALYFAMIRRRLRLALPVILVTATVSAVILVVPEVLYSLPPLVQRTLAPLNFSGEKTEIQSTLEGSDEWHKTLRDDSIPYWFADTTSFWVGHGFKAWDYSLSDPDAGTDIGDFDRRKQLAIEMGITENMFSAITNIFGTVGLILYGGFLINLGWRLWKSMGLCPPRSAARALCEFSLVTLTAAIVSCALQGHTPGIELIFWQLGVLAARPYICARVPAGQVQPAKPLPSFIPKSLHSTS